MALAVWLLSPSLAPRSQSQASIAACLLNDESLCIFVPLLMHSWVIQACHSTASGHLGIVRAPHKYLNIFVQVDPYEHLHPVVTMQLLEMRNTITTPPDWRSGSPLYRRRISLQSCSSLITSAAQPTFSQSQQPTSPLRASIFSPSTSIHLWGRPRSLLSDIAVSSFIQSFRTPYITALRRSRNRHRPPPVRAGTVRCYDRDST